jgi:ribosomal protein S18 acetylase RimI-like enzyme
MSVVERVRSGFADAERRRALWVAGGEVVELDGLEMMFTNLPDEGQNAGLVTGSPADPAGTIAAAAAAAHERGQPLGLEVERGRFPELEAAFAEAGLTKLFVKPALVADPRSMWRPAPPPDLHVSTVIDDPGRAAMVSVETETFGTDLEVARAMCSRRMLEDDGTRALIGMMDGRPVAQAVAYHHEGAVGVYGVGVSASARRRGIGSAMTVLAATSFPDADLVWLHPTDMARSMYERLGFHEVAVWDVWTAPTG